MSKRSYEPVSQRRYGVRVIAVELFALHIRCQIRLYNRDHFLMGALPAPAMLPQKRSERIGLALWLWLRRRPPFLLWFMIRTSWHRCRTDGLAWSP